MKYHRLLILMTFSVLLSACNLTWIVPEKEKISVTLKNTEVYDLNLKASGDEEGAHIEVQAEHFSQSEILFDESTEWRKIYRYKPEAGFVGEDYVEIETCTGGRSTGCNHHKKIKIEFEVTE